MQSIVSISRAATETDCSSPSPTIMDDYAEDDDTGDGL